MEWRNQTHTEQETERDV